MNQVYHHYTKWEEYKCGMWRSVNRQEEEEFFHKAVEFTGDADLYGEWMLSVIKSWPVSCEQNLTNSSMNRRAWIGHAACCLAINCPEYITRMAWHELSFRQQERANEKADIAIHAWEIKSQNKKQYLLFK